MKKIVISDVLQPASVIAAGCMRIAGMNDAEADTFVRTALDHDINFFDEADIYGGGRSEEVLGSVLAKDLTVREKLVIQSKCSIQRGFYDMSKEHILESVDGILSRLHTDYLDILLMHRPDALMEPEEVAAAFDELERTGKVRTFGVSNMNPSQMALLKTAVKQDLVVNQVQLSLAHTGILDAGFNVNVHNDAAADRDGGILEYARINNQTLQAWSPLQMGMFEGVFLGSDRYPELNKKLDELAEKYNTTADVIAYAWILRIPAKMQVILGTSKASRLATAAAATDIALTREEWYNLYTSAGNMLP